MSTKRQIVSGISIDANGQAHIEAALSEVLFDLALKLEENTHLPVDVQHVVAALVLAERQGDVAGSQTISADDDVLVSTLAVHVQKVFAVYGQELD